jgi:adenine phosphoribosyltransferase
MTQDLISLVRNVPDFPRRGILFRDITTLLQDPGSLRKSASLLIKQYETRGIQKVAAVESRGFILGSILAHELHAGFVPIRKQGKLPWKTFRQEYSLEYRSDVIEIHQDSIEPGEKVLFHDDLLATGGTARAACNLIEQLGGDLSDLSFLVELSSLHGRESLKGYDVFSVLRYEGEDE